MQVETIIATQKRLQRRTSIDEQESISQDSITSENDVESEAASNPNYVCTEDEIGVTMDYNLENTGNEAPADESRSQSVDRTQNSRRHRRERYQRRRRREDMPRACGRSWLIPFISGIFMGLIFLIIGIVFIAHFTELPDYIGILFILVSIPPFCMAINKYRNARQQELVRRRIQMRRRIIRELRGRENGAFRGGSLPVPDNPPAYANFAFNRDDLPDVRTRSERRRRGSLLSVVSGNVLPSYDDAVKPHKIKRTLSQKSSTFTEADLPQYRESDAEEENQKAETQFNGRGSGKRPSISGSERRDSTFSSTHSTEV